MVLDARRRLDPDAIGAVHGAVRAGGLLVLRAPEGGWEGRFAARATRLLAGPHGERPPTSPPPDGIDQAEAVARLDAMIAGDAPEPVVLVADRGRGKSAALGMAAGRALSEGLDVRVVAPRDVSSRTRPSAEGTG